MFQVLVKPIKYYFYTHFLKDLQAENLQPKFQIYVFIFAPLIEVSLEGTSEITT